MKPKIPPKIGPERMARKAVPGTANDWKLQRTFFVVSTRSSSRQHFLRQRDNLLDIDADIHAKHKPKAFLFVKLNHLVHVPKVFSIFREPQKFLLLFADKYDSRCG